MLENKHILFFDIDGTLINGFNGGRREVSQPLREAIKQLQTRGHLCFVATGRPLAYLNDDLLSLNFDGFVLCNGAIVLKDGEILKEHVFPKSVIKELVCTMNENGNAYFLNYLKEVYFSKNGIEENELFGKEVIKNGEIFYDYNLDESKVTKVEINQLEERTIAYLKNMQKDGYEVVWYPKINYAEVTMPHATKGESIKEVLQLLNIKKENSIAFGDGDNDIEMLQMVGRGVAMGNATEHVKEIADTVTETCEDEGIVRELQRLGLINNIL